MACSSFDDASRIAGHFPPIPGPARGAWNILVRFFSR